MNSQNVEKWFIKMALSDCLSKIFFFVKRCAECNRNFYLSYLWNSFFVFTLFRVCVRGEKHSPVVPAMRCFCFSQVLCHARPISEIGQGCQKPGVQHKDGGESPHRLTTNSTPPTTQPTTTTTEEARRRATHTENCVRNVSQRCH